MGGVCPLFFDGAVCDFRELPRPEDNDNITKIYNYLNRIRGINTNQKSFFSYGINKMNRRLRLNKLFYKFAALFK